MRSPSILIAFGLLLAGSPAATAATPPADLADPTALQAPAAGSALAAIDARLVARGGRLQIRWNDGLLRDLGLPRRGTSAIVDARLSKDSFLEAGLRGSALRPFSAGAGRLSTHAVFKPAAGPAIDWRDPTFVVRPGDALRVDFRSPAGVVLFYADSLMYGLAEDGAAIDLRSADLRIAPALAERIGRLEYVGLAVGELRGRLPVVERAIAASPKACGDPNWPGEPVPGVPGATYRADVFMIPPAGFGPAVQVLRCRASAAGGNCDGPAGAVDGEIVLAPNAQLRNNVNNGSATPTLSGDPLGTSSVLHAADVEWESKFTDTVPGPYAQPDQHPFLVWNLYRIDANGGLTQIARSGVKHAWLTTNTGAGCESCNGNHVLGRACADLYSTSNNDNTPDLGPRREIIPASGRWGRCRSIFDTDCNGVPNATSADLFAHRMLVQESAIAAAGNPGATWLFESWYVVREDVDIYNTMATLPLAMNWNGTAWVASAGAPFLLGSAVDRWVATAPAGVQAGIAELAAPEGRAKLGVRITPLAGGLYRYEYALMNFEYGRAVTTGAEPNLEVVRNRGFGGFLLPLGEGATLQDLVVADGDRDAANDWVATSTAGALSVRAPQPAASLDWGAMLRVGFTTASPPETTSASLEPAEAGAPAQHAISIAGPGAAGLLFSNGFE
jgi:hypothetical protein